MQSTIHTVVDRTDRIRFRTGIRRLLLQENDVRKRRQRGHD